MRAEYLLLMGCLALTPVVRAGETPREPPSSPPAKLPKARTGAPAKKGGKREAGAKTKSTARPSEIPATAAKAGSSDASPSQFPNQPTQPLDEQEEILRDLEFLMILEFLLDYDLFDEPPP